MSSVIPEVKDLYCLWEKEYLPMDLASKVQPLLSRILKLSAKLATASSVPEVRLSKYAPAIEKPATLRLLQQVNTLSSAGIQGLSDYDHQEFVSDDLIL